MKLNQLITQYITYRKSLGEKFKTNECYLKAFCKTIGACTPIKSISANKIDSFLYGSSNKITSGWFVKHTALLGLYQYALSRGYVTSIPLPSILPKRPPPFVPYIYSKEELKKIFDTALCYQKNKSYISPYMVRTVLILTYVLGLRLHESLSIQLSDIDMDNLVVTIQQSKFYKSRLVPFNQQIKIIIEKYLWWKEKQNKSQSKESFLFISKANKSLNTNTMNHIFEKIREKANIKRFDNATYQPRIHDLRHTFAVNRLTTWYQENKDLQKLLPILSTYLGHKHLAHTSVYLTMTNKLLQEANARFEKYVIGGE